MTCDSCEALMINGVFCHERGCPNTDKIYRDGDWVAVYECRECGGMIEKGERCNCYDEPSEMTQERVEIPAHLDAWMRGDRYGTIEGYTRQGMARVRLDKSGRIILCEPNELKPV